MLSPEENPPVIEPGMLAAEEAAPADSRADFEKGMSVAPKLSILLIVANTVIFFITLANGSLESREAIIQAGALSQAEFRSGEVWRGVSCMFLHGGLDHLFGNAVALFILGMACEHAFGLARTALLYMGAGALASLLSVTINPGPSVGASGAIFGLMGVMIAFFYRHRDKFHLRDNRIGLVLAVWAGYTILTGLASPFIDNTAHIGGLLAGLALGYLVPPPIVERAAGQKS
jgi:rhomboid protease GluP